MQPDRLGSFRLDGHTLQRKASRRRPTILDEAGVTLMDAQAEIAYLERLYALPSGEKVMENDSINRLAAAVLGDMERAAARVGTDGPWCYFCGADGPTK